MKKAILISVVGVTVALTGAVNLALADPSYNGNVNSGKVISTMRDGSELQQRSAAPDESSVAVSPTLRPRSYPMQAPTIPHDTQGYILTKDFNQCLTCHSRKTAPMMKIPAVGVSHYKNRDGEYLSDVSPRRYFCNQCHVTQHDGKPVVDNTFVEMEAVTNN